MMVLGLMSPVMGQQNEDRNRGVARVSVIAGEVSVRRGDSGDQVAATLNAPLVQQDRLLTGPGSKAELQFDFANMIRLGADTEIRLAELQYDRYQVNLAAGLVSFRVWQNSSAEVDVNTPVASIRPLERGEYRIQVFEDGTTEITVRDGEVDVFTPQGSRRLRENRTVRIRREANGETSFQSLSLAPVDKWDQWNRNRDRELAASRSNQYLPQGVYGGEQLDAYGDWVLAPPYGRVWRPRVAAGWAPYRLGRWSWLDWYGWSWVSYDPWGWAPYHYGRWFWNAGNWCWWPGSFGPRHFWSPGLVSFIGFGGGNLNLSVGFGWGNVGWVPLAPFESLHAWWGRGYYGGRNVNNITVINQVNITNVYRNARVDGAVSYVEAQNFNRGLGYGNGAGVRAARAAELSGVSEFRGPVGIAPSRESVGFAAVEQTGVTAGRELRSREEARFTARREAANVDRIPFEQQQRNFEQLARGTVGVRADEGRRGSGPGEADGFRRLDTGRSGTVAGENGYRRPGGEGFVNRSGGTRTAPGMDGFRRIGSEGVGSDGYRRQDAAEGGFVQRDSRGSSRTRGEDTSGWRRFGETGANSRERDGFVQRNGVTRGGEMPVVDGASRSRGVGAVDVSPRMVEPGDGLGGTIRPRIDSSTGAADPFGGGQRGERRTGWGGFGGTRNSSRDTDATPRRESSTEGGSIDSYGGGVRGGYRGVEPSRRQTGPYDGGYRGGGGEASPRMSAPSGGYGGGGYRGGGGEASPRMGAPSGGYGGGGYRGGNSSGGGHSGSGGGSRSPRGGN